MTLAAPLWTVAAASCAMVVLLATCVGSQPIGYVPKSGLESACLNFALDMYNNNSGRAMRAGPLSVGRASEQVLRMSPDHPIELWWRFFNTVLVDTTCPNTPGNQGATLNDCPIDKTISWRYTCDFKVWYAPSLRGPERLKMTYMMCYM